MVPEMMEDVFFQLMDKLEARVVRVTKKSLLGNMKTVETDHNYSFIREVFRRASREIMTDTVRNDGIRDALELVIIRVATSGLMVQAIVNQVFKEKKIMSRVAKFVAEQTKTELSVAAQQSAIAASLPPVPSTGDSSSSKKDWKLSRHWESPRLKKTLTSSESDD